MGSGSGFLSGYGFIPRSAYATPLELGFKPWTLDFSAISGGVAFPTDARFNPYDANAVPQSPLIWQTDDWDPGLRFWTLAFDTQLIEWLQDVDISAPSIMAAREFAMQSQLWQFDADTLVTNKWMLSEHLGWNPSATVTAANAWKFINSELDELVDLMEDDRGRYLAEVAEQADGIPGYFMHLLAMDSASKPHTQQLMRCGLAIGNLVYMHYKARFRRVRPSTLCPGLVPAFGPPRHPAFPSGHSFLGHFIALLLLEIKEVAARYGVGLQHDGSTIGGKLDWAGYKTATDAAAAKDLDGPLFWLAARLARNRERLGVHYRSDSLASRRLAGGVWSSLFSQVGAATQIEVPTLKRVLARARAEWV